MDHASRVVIDPAGSAGPIRLQVLGCLTLDTVRAVTEFLDRATLGSRPDLVVDLQGLDHLEPVGMAALQLHIDQRRAAAELPPIDPLLPPFPRDCQAVTP